MIEEAYRSRSLVLKASKAVATLYQELRRRRGIEAVKIMGFCGTHEWTITHYGLRSLMPPGVELVAGPGCPVCITPGYYVEAAIKLALDGVTVYTYGDAYRLPSGRPRGSGVRSLAEARAQGGRVEVVYSVLDAVRRAREKGGDSVFFAVGFETTAPSTAAAILRGRVPEGMSFIIVHRLTPPIMRYVFRVHGERSPIRGVIAPGHVSTIVGASAWRFVAEEYGIPVVVAGFEPLDVMLAVIEILRMLVEGKPRLMNEYKRAVTWEGNLEAKKMMYTVFEVSDAAWRGIGFVPKSGLRLREEYRRYDAFEQYGIPDLTPETFKYDLPPGCRCAEVTLGIAKPTDCPLFMKACTPGNPYGPCMVGSEGTCLIWAKYGGYIEELLRSEVSED